MQDFFQKFIPAVEWDVWVDQNTSRKCIIGKVDMLALRGRKKKKCNKLKKLNRKWLMLPMLSCQS